jgi:hypothetical protein
MEIHTNQLMGLAYAGFMSGNLHDAMKKWEKLSDDCRTINGEGHRSTLRVSYWIAGVLYTMSKYEEAEPMIRRLARTQEKVIRRR